MYDITSTHEIDSAFLTELENDIAVARDDLEMAASEAILTVIRDSDFITGGDRVPTIAEMGYRFDVAPQTADNTLDSLALDARLAFEDGSPSGFDAITAAVDDENAVGFDSDVVSNAERACVVVAVCQRFIDGC